MFEDTAQNQEHTPTRTENLIFHGLLNKNDYMKKVVAFLKPEYFQSIPDKTIFGIIQNFIVKYSVPPSRSAIEIELQKIDSLSQTDLNNSLNLVDQIYKTISENKTEWLLQETEAFCRDRAIYNAIAESIEIQSGKSKKYGKNAIPGLLSTALSVSFDTNIGHDYMTGMKERYDFYKNTEETIPFDIKLFNSITNNGIPKKSLCIVGGPPGGGKSIFLCHHAANCLKLGKNVLYITLEMAEERIAERIDANLMDVTVDSMRQLPFDVYERKFNRATQTIKGKLIIKQYPTSSANAMHFRHLIDELKIKKNFVPEVVIIDYLGICASSTYKPGAVGVNSYTVIKAIAEELRALAIEYNVQVFSATQYNREGIKNSDVGMENTADSIALTFVADIYLAIIISEDLEKMNQIMFKQLKNRYNDLAVNRKFVVGLNKAKMKFYDLEDSAQESINCHVDPLGNKTSENLLTGMFGDKDGPDSKFKGWD